MAEKAKILILSTAYLPYIGGSELAIKNITDRIKDFEFHIITARLDRNLPKEEMVGNVYVFRIGDFFSLLDAILPKIFLPLAIFLKARLLLKKYDYKLIHSFQISGAAGAGWLLKIFYPRIPFLVTMQEGKDLRVQGFLINFFRKLIIKRADSATAISQYLKDYILAIKDNLSVEVIPNGVDLKNFSRQFSYGELTDLEDNLGIKPDDKVIISVSRLVLKNGLDLLIEAINFLETRDKRQETSRYKLLIVGEGPLKKSLKFKAKALNLLSARSSTNDSSASMESLKLKDSVIFTGSVRHEDLSKYLKISDVFVRPSRSEGLGSSFLEAMAANVPIIGTKVGGIPDFLEDQKTGLFCSLDPSDIASKINIILENDQLKQEIVRNARRLVEEKYDWDRIAEEYRKIYEIIHNHPRL